MASWSMILSSSFRALSTSISVTHIWKHRCTSENWKSFASYKKNYSARMFILYILCGFSCIQRYYMYNDIKHKASLIVHICIIIILVVIYNREPFTWKCNYSLPCFLISALRSLSMASSVATSRGSSPSLFTAPTWAPCSIRYLHKEKHWVQSLDFSSKTRNQFKHTVSPKDWEKSE